MSQERITRFEEALQALRNGRMVMVMDDESRENECDLVLAAEFATKEALAFMIRHSTGIICCSMLRERLEKFGLKPAVDTNTDKNKTNFYTSTDFLPTTTTGVSAFDRAETIRAFVSETSKRDDFSKPGHIFTLCAEEEGILKRSGHTEASVDLCRFADLQPCAAIGELMTEGGEMFRLEESQEFAKLHKIPLITMQDLREAWKRKSPILLHEHFDVVRTKLPISIRSEITFYTSVYLVTSKLTDYECVIVVKGEVKGKEGIPCRVHSECLTGEVLHSQRCDCGKQLELFLNILDKAPEGILVYVRGHEGRGIGLKNKLLAYNCQDLGADTVEANEDLGFAADLRSYDDVDEILFAFEIKSIDLYTNNPEKVKAMKRTEVRNVIPVVAKINKFNQHYLETKKSKLGHRTLVHNSLKEGEDQEKRPEPLRLRHENLS